MHDVEAKGLDPRRAHNTLHKNTLKTTGKANAGSAALPELTVESQQSTNDVIEIAPVIQSAPSATDVIHDVTAERIDPITPIVVTVPQAIANKPVVDQAKPQKPDKKKPRKAKDEIDQPATAE